MRVRKLVLILFMLLLLALGISASDETRVRFNFYEGIRQKEKTQPSVAASYHLKPLVKSGLMLDPEQTEEKAKLKRIYNLKDVKSLLRVTWQWQEGETTGKYREIILNGHEYRIQLTVKKRKDGFRLEVIERIGEESKTLLDTEMTLPVENTAIFGFEDSLGKIYFLSFCREKEGGAGGGPMDVSREEVPELVERVDPVYPPEAVEKQEEGTVIMEVVVDKEGNVSEVNVTAGKNMVLNKAAVDAVKQWKYRPCLKGGVPKPIKFIVVLDFYFY